MTYVQPWEKNAIRKWLSALVCLSISQNKFFDTDSGPYRRLRNTLLSNLALISSNIQALLAIAAWIYSALQYRDRGSLTPSILLYRFEVALAFLPFLFWQGNRRQATSKALYTEYPSTSISDLKIKCTRLISAIQYLVKPCRGKPRLNYG